jgi:anti-sigma factor RsiW
MKAEDCESIFAALSEYLDGELPPADCEQLERHIHDCAPCVEFVNSLRKSIRLGGQYQMAEPPPPIPAEVKQSLEQAYRSVVAQAKESDQR